MTSFPNCGKWKQGTEDILNEFHNCFCPNCGGGEAHTVLLPTSIPMFREIYIMTLTCSDCDFKNTEVNFSGEIQSKGCRTTLLIEKPADRNRQVIKADSASIHIPVIEFEIPPNTQRGTVSTVEGIMMRAVENLESVQPTRLRLGDMANFRRCQRVINQLQHLAGHEELKIGAEDEDGLGTLEDGWSFEFIVDDPSGNSFIESPNYPVEDCQIQKDYYTRTPAQDVALGLKPSVKIKAMESDPNDEISFMDTKRAKKDAGGGHINIEVDENVNDESWGRQEALTFQTQCASCLQNTETKMCMINIPHFKDVIIMSMVCDKCGFRSNEIKGGGGIPKFGTRIVLSVRSPQDLSREILKSDTAGIEIPELDLEMEEGSLGGIFTTVEGLLQKIGERLAASNPFIVGDSAVQQHIANDGQSFSPPSSSSIRYLEFLKTLNQMKQGKKLPFTLCIIDPLSNSGIGPIPEVASLLSARLEKGDNSKCLDLSDPNMQIEEFTRSWSQNESLGLNDMTTENYRRIREKENEGEGTAQETYYGTDRPNETPDQFKCSHIRSPDHPHESVKGATKGDSTKMGRESLTFVNPSFLQKEQKKGKKMQNTDNS